MEVKHKNLKEDFKLLVSLGNAYNGEQFTLTFTSGKYGAKSYTCSYDGTKYTNCEMADTKHVLCSFDNHGLPCGLLMCETKVSMPDTSMADGNFALNSKSLVEFKISNVSYHLELTNGKSDIIETVESTFELLGTVLKGAKGDTGATGQKGADGLTTAVKVNGVTHTQVNGVVDLGTIAGGSGDGKVKDVKVDGVSVLNESTGVASITMPTVPTKTSDITNDSGFLTQHQSLAGKQDVINDLDTIRSGAALGATALQSEAHLGDYSKPDGGIPKTDLSSDVQTSLGKADTALQSFTESDPTVPSWAKADSKPSYASSEITDGDSNVGAKLLDLSQKVGDLDDLETTAKSDLVSAINEAAQSGGSVDMDEIAKMAGAVVLTVDKTLSDVVPEVWAYNANNSTPIISYADKDGKNYCIGGLLKTFVKNGDAVTEIASYARWNGGNMAGGRYVNGFCDCPNVTSVFIDNLFGVSAIEQSFGSDISSTYFKELKKVVLRGITCLPNLMFGNNTNIEEVIIKDSSFKSGGQGMGRMFVGCNNLRSVKFFNCDFSVISTTKEYGNAFGGCSKLADLDAMVNLSVDINLSGTSLTHDSLVNVIEGLYDWSENPLSKTVPSTYPTLTLGSTLLAKLNEEEIAVATAKNWTVA